ncbi:MAG: ATP-binding protein [Bacteroidota bacterium]
MTDDTGKAWSRDITVRMRMEAALPRAKDELETGVKEGMAALEHANRVLREEIAERKRTEIELERRRARLEELVRERTLALEAANARLQEEVAGRREAESKLAYMASFPDHNPNPVMEVDLDGRIRYANPASLGLFPDLRAQGLTHPWLVDWAAVVRPFREGKTNTCVRDLAVGERSYQQMFYYSARDRFVRIYGHDITERKRVETEMAKENRVIALANKVLRVFVEEAGEDMYDKALDIMREGMESKHGVFGYIDEGGDLICPTMSRMFDECEMREKCVIYPHEEWKGLWSRALLEKKTFYANEPSNVPPGHVPIRNNLAAPILFQGNVIGLFNFANKDSGYTEEDREFLEAVADKIAPVLYAWVQKELREKERKQSERAVRESQMDLNRAQAVAHTGSWRLNVPRNELLWSDETYRIFGIPVGTPLTYNTFLAAVHPEDREYVDQKWTAALHGEPYDIEHRIVAAGGIKWVRERAELELDQQGAAIGGFGTVQDITERKLFEQALLEKREELIALNEELTAQAKELNAAYQELREADRRKNEFLAVLSHELRNPLTPIRNSLDILDRVAPGGEQARRAKDVLDRQVGQLARLVDDLLDLTRITRNKIKLQRRRLELNQLVRRTMEDYRSLFEKNGVRLSAEFVTTPIFVHADEARLAQVVGNLLQNAAKFTRRGDSTTVSVGYDCAGHGACIRVADTGAGIQPEMFPLLFQPFIQADRTLDRSRGGLGLGLALVKGLVELHGGRVSATSEGIGKGSEFVVRLPCEETPDEAEPPPAARPGFACRRRVLIIEDNVDVAESLRELIELDEHVVAVAHSGPEGLATARQFRPEVLLCDIGLPGMDGYDVARAFRADAALRSVFLVALSGYALPEDLRRAREAGFDRHLAKPPTPAELERALMEVARG